MAKIWCNSVAALARRGARWASSGPRSLVSVGLLLLAGSVCFFPGSAVGAVTNVVRVGNYWFNPTNVFIAPGDTVLWTNISTTAHDTTARSGLWASPTFSFTGTYRFTFTNAGVYPYICALHIAARPEQTGTVTVASAPVAVALQQARWQSGEFIFAFPSRVGGLYTVWQTPTFTPAGWQPVTNLTGTGALLWVTNRNAGVGPRFYRVESR